MTDTAKREPKHGELWWVKLSDDSLDIATWCRSVERETAPLAPVASPEAVAALIEALDRQCDNIAFILNHMKIPEQWLEKFNKELIEDRAFLMRAKAEKLEPKT